MPNRISYGEYRQAAAPPSHCGSIPAAFTPSRHSSISFSTKRCVSAGVRIIGSHADADTGFGNELNMTRTVREYESRGVAAIQIEDQTFPKRCGHLEGKTVVPRADFVRKITAAVEARKGDMLIIARTDARATDGLDEAIARMNECFAAGADVAFVEALQSLEETRIVPERVKGPCPLNFVVGGRSPAGDLQDVERMGYRIAIVPALTIMATLGACDAALKELRTTHRHPAPPDGITLAGMFQRLGAEEWDVVSRRFGI